MSCGSVISRLGVEKEAQAWENTLLAMYNYAWNVRNNGNIRVVLW